MAIAFAHNLRPTFDPARHITAGQLRRLGFYLQEMIPDDAFVRRVAVGIDESEAFADDDMPTARLRVRESFRRPHAAA